MNTKKFGIMLIGLMLVVGLLFAAVPAGKVSAATLCVAPGGTGGCYATIQGAIDAASAGDIIEVGDGTYDYDTEGHPADKGLIKVSKPLTIKAADDGNDIRPIINASGIGGLTNDGVFKIYTTTFTSGTVIIEGFEITGIPATGTAITAPMYQISGSENTVIIRDNLIHGTLAGIDLWGSSISVESPLSQNMVVSNVQIINNEFYNLGYTGYQGFGIMLEDLAGQTKTGGQFAVVIEGNSFGTIVDKSVSEPSAGILLFRADSSNGEAVNFRAAENNFTGPVSIDIAIISGEGVAYPELIDNNFGNSAIGIYSTITDIINASGNWWGSVNGPATGKNIGNVDYTPWLAVGTDTSTDAGFQGDFSTLWVDDDSPQTGTVGHIQEGINLVSGSTVNVAAGTYIENVVVNKSVEIAGASQAGVILRPALSAANPCEGSSLCGGAASNVFLVSANDVIIHDLTVDGDNPDLTSGIVRGGADLDARNGIIKNTNATYNNLEVYNTTVKNIYLRGIYSTGGTFNFHHNTVTNVQGDAYSIGMFAWYGPGIMANNTVSYANDAISANHSKGIQFLSNTVTHSGSGIHTDNSNDGGGVADLIQRNSVDCTGMTDAYGIWTFVPYVAPTVNANTITNCSIGLSAWGQGAAVVTQFTNNVVSGTSSVESEGEESVGAYITTDIISWGYTDVSVYISENVITGYDKGLYFTADDQPWNNDPDYPYIGKTITATFLNNSIYGNTVNAERDSDDTDGIYIINASGNYWGSADPATVKAGIVEAGTRVIDYTPWLAAGTDTSTDPGFQGDFSTLWVDDDSPQTGTVGRIQEGINLVSGSTVNVAAGLYDERVVIDKTVTLLGATHGISKKTYTPPVGYAYDTTLESVIKPTSDIDVSVLKISADGVVVDGFVVANTSILTAGGMKNLVEFTHTFEFPTGSSLINSVIGPLTGPAQDGNLGRFGVVAPGPSSTSATKTRVMVISDNYIYDCLGNGGGIGIIGAADTGVEINTGMEITDNTITGHHRSGIEIAGMISGTSTTPVLIADNNITNNGGQLSTDAAQLKYGNGIAFIRIGSDRTNGEPYGIPQFIEISGNLIEGNEKNGIYLGPIVQNLTIEGNTIQNNGNMTGFQDWDGIRIDLNEMYYAAPNPLITSFFDDVVINKNKIVGNGALGVNLLGGVPDSGDVDATINWWGSPCGPTDSSVNGVSEHVVYSPWYVDSLMTTTAATNTTPGFYTFPTDSTTLYMNAIIACAEPGSTLTFATSGTPFHGGLIVGPSRTDLTFELNGQTVGASSPAFTIEGDNITIQGPGVLDGDGSSDPGVWVKDGADNFILDGVEVREWANGIQVSGNHASFKMASNWIHDNVGAGLLTDADMVIDIGSITTIEGNLFKENGAEGVKHQGATSLDVTYNSWGDIAGPLAANGDGVSGLAAADYSPWTYSEVFVDMVPDTLATQAAVNENGTFSIAVKVDAEKLYAVQYKLTYDPAYLQLVDLTDGTFKGLSGGCTNNYATAGVVTVYCLRFSPAVEVDNALGETISTLTFRAAGTGLMANGPWLTDFDLSTEATDLSSGAIGGIKVFVNNGGYGAPSTEAGHTITDAEDGRVIISGLANFSGYIDLEGRVNDSGATITVYNQSTIAGATASASGTSASSGKYTTVYLGEYQLTVPTTYWFQVDARLYLPTTALATTMSYPTLPTVYLDSGVLATRTVTPLKTVQLLGGDANDNNAVDTSDLGCLGGAYGKPAEACGSGSSDVNGDGKVDIYDLVLLGGNYDKNSSPWGQLAP